MIEKLLIKLSGNPKPKNIVEIKESIKPFIFIPQIIIAFTMGYCGIKFQWYGLVMISIIFAWQAGWGMSVTRFVNHEINKREGGIK